jgi:hypothetical protein
MPLPANLLRMVENHPCFSGVWSADAAAQCVIDPAQPARSIEVVHCDDCLTYHLAVDRRLLDPGVRRWHLADAVTAHARRHRGYALSVGGYHVAGSGFWLSAAYWAHLGVFVLSSRGSGPPLDVLIRAMQHGVIPAPDPRMTQAQSYRLHDVHLSVVPPPVASSLSALLASSSVSTTPKRGFVPVTLAELKPAAGAAVAPRRSKRARKGSTASEPAPRSLQIGERCPVCGEIWMERPLFRGTYVGCGCG